MMAVVLPMREAVMAVGSEGMSIVNCFVSPFLRPMSSSSNAWGYRPEPMPYCVDSEVMESMTSPLSSVAVIFMSTYLSSLTLVLAGASTMS